MKLAPLIPEVNILCVKLQDNCPPQAHSSRTLKILSGVFWGVFWALFKGYWGVTFWGSSGTACFHGYSPATFFEYRRNFFEKSKIGAFCFRSMHFLYENTTGPPLKNFKVRTLVPPSIPKIVHPTH